MSIIYDGDLVVVGLFINGVVFIGMDCGIVMIIGWVVM